MGTLVFQPVLKQALADRIFAGPKRGRSTGGFSIFKALALWADAFYKSKCPSVCLTFEVPFRRIFAPTS